MKNDMNNKSESVDIGVDLDAIAQREGWENMNDVIRAFLSLKERVEAPESLDSYAFTCPKHMEEIYDHDMTDWFRQCAYDQSLTRKQAEAIHNAFIETIFSKWKQSREELYMDHMAFSDRMRQQWGADFSVKLESARRAARYFGMDPESVAILEDIVGGMKVMDALASIGDAMTEDSLAGHQDSEAMLSPQRAHEKRMALSQDRDFMSALMDKGHPSHKSAMKKINNLTQAITRNK